jgi:hypothetical protein
MGAVGDDGLEHTADSPKKTAERKNTRTQSAQIAPDLAKIVAAWPTLPKAIRRAMLAMVEAAGS